MRSGSSTAPAPVVGRGGASASATGPRRRSWWARTRRARSVVSLVLGILVLLTPVVLTHVKNVEQAGIAERYAQTVRARTQAERDALIEAAREYNKHLPPVGAPDPWVNGVDTTSADYGVYRRHLDVDSVLARVRIPAVGIDLPVYHGTSQQTLAAGVGHLYGTALPVGGDGTHAVLTGHTGLATLTMFDNLTHVKEGDTVIVETAGQTLAYRVDQIQVVLPDQIEAVRPVPGHDRLTLVTCTPYGINSHRLLVRGERVPVPETLPAQAYRSPWQPWMIGALVIAGLGLLYLLWWLLARRRRRDRRERLARAEAA